MVGVKVADEIHALASARVGSAWLFVALSFRADDHSCSKAMEALQLLDARFPMLTTAGGIYIRSVGGLEYSINGCMHPVIVDKGAF